MIDSPKFGSDFVGDIPWGTHLCQFYETKTDLIEILVPYFAEGLNSNEVCVWVTSEPLEVEEATAALEKKIPNFSRYVESGQILILPHKEWYLKGGTFDADRVLEGWVNKEREALGRGFEGLRLAGNTFWIERSLWNAFTHYEEAINNVIGQHRMIAVCTYALGKCSGNDVIDVVKNHGGTIIKQSGKWIIVGDVIRRRQAQEALRATVQTVHILNEKLRMANDELWIANKELDLRVQQRSSELATANEELKKANEELSAANEKLRQKAQDRKDAEQAARASSLYARSLIEASLDPLVTINAEGKITDVNQATEAVTGYAREELIGSDFSTYFTEPEKAREGYQQVFSDGLVKDYPLAVRHKSGRVTEVLYHAALYRDERGEVQGVFAAARDITDQKRAQEELQRYSDHLEKLVEERTAAEQTARTHAHQQQMLSRIITAGNEAYSLESACAAMLDAAMELIIFTDGALFLLDEAAGVTEQQYARGFNDEVLVAARRIPLTTSFYAQVYEGTPKFFNDYSTEGTEQFRVLLPDIRILALIPLVSKRRVIGHYVLASAREPPFTDEEQALLIAIGQQAGTVFARLQAEADARTQAEHTALLNKIIRRSNTTTDAQDFLQYVCDLLVEECGYDAVDMRIVTDKDDISEQVAATGYSAEFNEQFRFMSIDDPILRGVYRGEPYFPSRYTKTHVDLVRATRMASNGIVPLAVGETIIGDMGVALKDYRPFSPDEQALLVSIGRETGTVLARLQAEQEIRVHSAHLEDLVKERTAKLEDLAKLPAEDPNAVMRFGLDGSVLYANSQGEALLSSDRFPLDQVLSLIVLTCASGTTRTTEVTDGERIFHTTLVPIGAKEYVNVYVMDVTKEKRAESALRDAQRLAGIGETAAMIGHDLRNPLQGLQYIVDLQNLRFDRMSEAQRSDDDWQKERQLFNKIREQVYYMDKIVADLQDYARPLEPDRETVSVHKLIVDVLESLPHSDGKVEINADLPDLIVEVEPHLMHRVFSNLVLNAIQAMPDGGLLSITASSADGSVAISVRDTGVGIPEEMREKLFSPLMTGKAKGTGLGLAVVKRIVDAHGGAITFESEKNKGTTFTVTLPVLFAG